MNTKNWSKQKKVRRLKLIKSKLKQKNLEFFLKPSVSEQRCKSDDNLFQAAGPEKLNPRSPNLVLVQRLTYLDYVDRVQRVTTTPACRHLKNTAEA